MEIKSTMRRQQALCPIQLGRLLNLTNEVGVGFVVMVHRRERDEDTIASYCADEISFHEKYFSLKNSPTSSDDGVFLCCLEISKDLWLVTKAAKRERGEVKEFHEEYFGRLLISFHKNNHSGNISLKKQIEKMSVHSILDRPYSFLKFIGYNQVRLKLAELIRIVRLNLSDWRIALRAVSAVYMISDTKKGGAYVGSAYGNDGLWGRWRDYASGDFVGTGGDRGLIKRIDKDNSYSQHFVFSILEVFNKNTHDKEIRKRESWWKDTLRTRKNHNNCGMNEN